MNNGKTVTKEEDPTIIMIPEDPKEEENTTMLVQEDQKEEEIPITMLYLKNIINPRK